MNGGSTVWSGSEEHRRFGVSLGHLYGVGSRAQIATFSLLQGRKLPTTSTVISACGGKRGKERVRESPAQAQGAASPGGAQSIRRLGEWCEVWCLLCQGKAAVYEGRASGPRTVCSDPSGLLFPPFFKCSPMCRRTNTDVDTIN